MKRILNNVIYAAVMIFLTAGCAKPTETVPTLNAGIVGEWHLTKTEIDGAALDTKSDIYIAFYSNCTFELFQKSGDQQRYTKFTGTCSFDGKALTGTYSDGTSWGSVYTVGLTAETLTLTNDTLTEVQTYTKEAISEDIRNNADIKAKSSGEEIIPIL